METHARELSVPTHALCLVISKIIEIEGKEGVMLATKLLLDVIDNCLVH
jgi:hypothetical protein